MTKPEYRKTISSRLKGIKTYFSTHHLVNEKAFYLYNLGNNDRHIALKLNRKFKTSFSSDSIGHWRKINNLSPTGTCGNVPCKITDRIAEKIISMRKSGLTINEISFKLGISPAKIAVWSSLNYDSRKESNKIKLNLYNKGLLDPEIADILNLSTTAIFMWRKINNLPSNYRK